MHRAKQSPASINVNERYHYIALAVSQNPYEVQGLLGSQIGGRKPWKEVENHWAAQVEAGSIRVGRQQIAFEAACKAKWQVMVHLGEILAHFYAFKTGSFSDGVIVWTTQEWHLFPVLF